MATTEPRIKPFKIVSLQGGGIRGAFQAVLIARLAEAVPAWLPFVTMYAGTSVGGINACLLASGVPPGELEGFYLQHGRGIFSHHQPEGVGQLVGAGYSQDYLHDTLTGVFGDKTLGDLKAKILIPAFQLDNDGTPPPRSWGTRFFQNFSSDNASPSERIVDVLLRSSAAPTYFPPYEGRYIDGGVSCNNPSFSAVSAAINPDVGNQLASDIRLFSISCGRSPEFIAPGPHDWGAVQWVYHGLVNILMDSNVDIADYHCRQNLASKAYFRLDPVLPASVGLADARRLEDLLSWARDVDLTEAISFLEKCYLG